MDAPSQRLPKRILLSVPHMGSLELGYVQEAFATNWLSTVGPNLTVLEQAFSRLIGLPSVALASGTAGIHLGLKLLDLKPGDEVITPTLTFAASCNPILYERGIPVFIDSERNSWNLDPQLLAEFLKKRAKVNRLPRAVTVVHLFGQSADLESILETCRHYELPLLEDAAESLGAQYKGRHPGTYGDIGVYSFNGNKIITSTGGGMLVSPRSEWVDKARYWSSQARDPDPHLHNYLHSEVGYNYRLSNVLAGIARGQLEVLELRVQQRRAVFERYRQGFAEIPGIEPQPDAVFGMSNAQCRMPNAAATSRIPGAMRKTDASFQPLSAVSAQAGSILNPQPTSLHTRWLSCFLIDQKKFGMSQAELMRFLDSANVESRPIWKPMHTQKLYQGCECIGGEVAEDLNRRGLCLPSSSSLSLADQQFVIDRICEAHFAGRRAEPQFLSCEGAMKEKDTSLSIAQNRSGFQPKSVILVTAILAALILVCWAFPTFWYTRTDSQTGYFWLSEHTEIRGWTYQEVPVAKSAETTLVADRLVNGEFTNSGGIVRVFSAKRYQEKQNEIGLFMHTPDRCWTEAGWKLEPAVPDTAELLLHGISLRFERRVFTIGNQRELVYFCGLTGGQPLPYRLDHNLSIGLKYQLRTAQDNTGLMVRASDQRLWDRVWESFISRRPLLGPKQFLRVSTPIQGENSSAADPLLKEFLLSWLMSVDYQKELEAWHRK